MLVFSNLIISEVDTTANIRGTTNTGGVSIVATHTPTGTVKRTVSSDSGNYSLSFLPIGGPYKIVATKSGFQAQSIDNLFLILLSFYRQFHPNQSQTCGGSLVYLVS